MTLKRLTVPLMAAVLGTGGWSLLQARPASPPRLSAESGRPNIVVIMADDLDTVTMKAALQMGLMPRFVENIGSQGIEFVNAFTSNPLCAPSRATYLTGLYSRTHHVYSNSSRNGTILFFNDRSTIATWLTNQSSYASAHFGKYLN